MLAAGLQAAVNGGVTTGEPQRDRIGVAAHDRRVVHAKLARRLGQSRLSAGETGPLRREGYVELVLARDRAQASGNRALERLGRRILGRAFAFRVGGHHSALVIQWRSFSRPNLMISRRAGPCIGSTWSDTIRL